MITADKETLLFMADRNDSSLLKQNRYAVIGAGLSGKGAARLLLWLGKKVVIFDDKDCSSDPEVQTLSGRGVTFGWGRPVNGGGRGILDEVDALIPSPGVPHDHPLRVEARRRGILQASEIELAWLRADGAKIAAVTGTNGKTTVTMLIRHIFEAAGKRAIEAGNIGHSFSDAVLESEDHLDETWFSVEVSSFQLEDCKLFAPDAAVLLNITPDHLDRHKGMEEYAQAKARITAKQTADQSFVVNQDDPWCLKIARESSARVLYFSLNREVEQGAWLDGDVLTLVPAQGRPRRLTELDRLRLIGLHNVANCLAAACAASSLGISHKVIGAALETFRGAPHRLEHVGAIGGVDYIDDSKATNIDAQVKAIASFANPVHLIAGGRDKNSPFETILPQIQDRVVHAYLIGEAAEKIEAAWAPGIKLTQCGTMDTALERATENAREGEVVLLAPGCASFDQFVDYKDRGRVFARWVQQRMNKENAHEPKRS